ncbi:hypothetical protein T440DRAFT_540910, partial [Plenodomus tracheiphilus IPT5]
MQCMQRSVWRMERRSFSSAMLQDSLQRSTRRQAAAKRADRARRAVHAPLRSPSEEAAFLAGGVSNALSAGGALSPPHAAGTLMHRGTMGAAGGPARVCSSGDDGQCTARGQAVVGRRCSLYSCLEAGRTYCR